MAWSEMAAAYTYSVKHGDTLGKIAKANGIPVRELARSNKIKINSILRVGQKLVIPGLASDKSILHSQWHWRSPGGKPYLKGKEWTDSRRFGKKLDKAFQIFQYPPLVEKTLRDQIWKDFHVKFSLPENKFEIENGYTAEVMMDGSGYHRNVLADFKKPNTRVIAKRYQAELEGSIYMVDIPLSCGNESKKCCHYQKRDSPYSFQEKTAQNHSDALRRL
jgi:murein DD-endopeptidase MepM/ murein hydrolase activator NlpD